MFVVFCYYFILFFIYSFLGWIVETIVCSIAEKKVVLNRGFLIGPYLPLYGTAAILMILFLTEYKQEPFILFCMAVVYASLLEYFTSLIMEKLFNARWWDYTDKKFNINGRICLEYCLFFGVLGFIVLYVVHPAIVFVLHRIPIVALQIISVILFVIFLLDVIITFFILSNLNIKINNIHSDATDEIDKEVKKLLAHYHVLYKRLFQSFPKVHINTKYGDVLINRIGNRFNEIDEFLDKKKKEIKEIKKDIKKLKEKTNSKETIEKEKQKLKKVRKRKV